MTVRRNCDCHREEFEGTKSTGKRRSHTRYKYVHNYERSVEQAPEPKEGTKGCVIASACPVLLPPSYEVSRYVRYAVWNGVINARRKGCLGGSSEKFREVVSRDGRGRMIERKT